MSHSAQHDEESHFWVFGYGSLMWRPGFDHVEAVPARMGGVHRAPCIYSWVHRGTQTSPGIVLGLDRGGFCNGLAFKVLVEKRDEVVDYLRERELVTNVYKETVLPAQLHGAPQEETSISCLTYVVDPYHEQYAGSLPVDDLVEIIARAEGQSGKNDVYFLDTARQLRTMGIQDDMMEAIAERLLSQANRPVTDRV